MTIYTNSVWVERGKNNSEILEYSYINNLNNKRTQSFNYENKKEMTIYTNSVWVTSWIITQKTKNKKRNDNIYKFCLGGARKKQFRNIRIQLYK